MEHNWDYASSIVNCRNCHLCQITEYNQKWHIEPYYVKFKQSKDISMDVNARIQMVLQ